MASVQSDYIPSFMKDFADSDVGDLHTEKYATDRINRGDFASEHLVHLNLDKTRKELEERYGSYHRLLPLEPTTVET